jgi:hypothetical protein
MQNERTKESQDKGTREVVAGGTGPCRELPLLCLTDVNEGSFIAPSFDLLHYFFLTHRLRLRSLRPSTRRFAVRLFS